MNVGWVTVTVTVFPCASTDVEVKTGWGVGVVTGGATGVKIVGGAMGKPDVVVIELGVGVGVIPDMEVEPLDEPDDAPPVVTGPVVSLLETVVEDPDPEIEPGLIMVVIVETMVVVIYVF